MTQREQKCQLKLYFSGKGEPKLERTEFNNPQRPDLNDDPNQPKRTAYGSKPEGKTGSGQNLFSFQQLAIALCILLIKFKLKEHGAEELLATEASPGSSIRNALSGQDSKKSVALRAIFGEYGDLLESYPDRVKLIAKRLPAENIQVFCDERPAARKKILWIVNKLEEQYKRKAKNQENKRKRVPAWPKSLPAAAAQKLCRVAIVKSDQLAYTREVLATFEKEVRRLNDEVKIRDQVWPLVNENFQDQVSSVEPDERLKKAWEEMGNNKTWDNVWDEVFGGFQPNYYVTVGTPASFLVKQYLDRRQKRFKDPRRPLIYLAVTEPLKAGLLDHEHITGVRFGPGAEMIVAGLFKALESNKRLKLVYLYDKNDLVDATLAAQLKRTVGRRIEMRATEGTPTADTLPTSRKGEILYFAYLALERALEAPAGLELVSRHPFVTSYRPSSLSADLAVAMVSVDNKEIGESGAKIIEYLAGAEARNETLSLRKIHVKQPKAMCVPNAKMAERWGIEVDDEAFKKFMEESEG